MTAIVVGDWDEVRAVRAQAEPDEPDRAWRETVLMVHLFAGFPRQVEAYQVLASVGGLGEITDDEIEGIGDYPERGHRLFDTIYGGQSDRVQSVLRAGHPDVHRWILGHAYGRVLTRPGLSARTRELFAAASLAVMNQDAQFASHLRGALRCGATPEEVNEMLREVDPRLDPEHRDHLHAIAQRFTER